jgi:hypothetical protein
MPKSALKTAHRLEIPKILGTAVCSGTAVGKHTILTAAHCNPDTDVVVIDGTPSTITNRVFDGYDHELITVTTSFKHFSYFVPAKVKLGQEVWILGNPKGIPFMLRRGIFAGIFKVSAPVPGIMDGTYSMHMYDINSTNGDSGSAVFNKRGEIVDVLSVSFLSDGFHLMGAFELHFNEADLANIE